MNTPTCVLSCLVASVLAASLPAAERSAADAVTPVPGGLANKEGGTFSARIKAGPIGLVFFGDSITYDWPTKSPETWKRFDAYQQADFGIGGEHTEHVLWRMLHGDLDGYQAKAVVILIGTNNFGHCPGEQPAWVAAGVKKILETVREKQPQAQILLLAVFPRDDKGSVLGTKVTELNALIKPYADGKHIHWLDIGDVFMDGDGNIKRDIMGDQLHPNDEGYHLWYDRMWPTLKKLLDAK
jgi:beta-glucosidase